MPPAASAFAARIAHHPSSVTTGCAHHVRTARKAISKDMSAMNTVSKRLGWPWAETIR
jgi:hypothetical protein